MNSSSRQLITVIVVLALIGVSVYLFSGLDQTKQQIASLSDRAEVMYMQVVNGLEDGDAEKVVIVKEVSNGN
jgi:uncharacterized membrane protein YukC